ncbi:MAG: hypothetical protein QW320_01515 [Ignisphaera sp.]
MSYPNSNIFAYMVFYGFKIDSIERYLADSYLIIANHLQKTFAFLIVSTILMSVNVIIVLKNNNQHKLLLELFLYFIFTGDVASTLMLFIIVASLLKFLRPFFNMHRTEKEHSNTCNELLPDLFITIGLTMIILGIEVLFFRFITLFTSIAYLILFTVISLAKPSQILVPRILKIILISIPPFGLAILV